jgi:hypothetical protein
MPDPKPTLEYSNPKIDQNLRVRLANAIEDFLDGRIDNWRLDDLAFTTKTEDMLWKN